ncbi:hypothetical protein Tco_0705305 [Tanacetum coccineum]|uniref:Uncharacterized protein n=1 Tax=Tanacetum coccineum TaxID=301880 RepID=A0ABQ4Y4A2_9ASTR
METAAGMSREAWGPSDGCSDLDMERYFPSTQFMHSCQRSQMLQSADHRATESDFDLLTTSRTGVSEMRALRAAARTDRGRRSSRSRDKVMNYYRGRYCLTGGLAGPAGVLARRKDGQRRPRSEEEALTDKLLDTKRNMKKLAG